MRSFTKVTAVVFCGIASIHILRSLWFPDLIALLPLELSAIASVVGMLLLWAYFHYYEQIKFRDSYERLAYDLSWLIISIGVIAHLSRLTHNPYLFETVPLWGSFVAAPILLCLAYNNWKIVVK